MKNLARRVRQLEKRLPKAEPAADLESELTGWRAFIAQVVLPAAAGHPAALAHLAAGLPAIEEQFADEDPAAPGEAGTTARRRNAFILLGQLMAPYPEVKTIVSAELRRLTEKGQHTRMQMQPGLPSRDLRRRALMQVASSAKDAI